MSRKTKISLFCILNVATILWANLPESLVELSSRAFVRMGSPATGGPCVQCGRYWINKYAHVTGFGAVWKLFVGLPRYDYWITVVYEYADDSREERPRPYPDHAVTQLTPFFNHRENKIDLQLLAHPPTRVGFGRWLCRREEGAGRSIRSVQLVVHRRNIPAIDEIAEPGPMAVADEPFEIVLCGDGEVVAS